MIFHHEFAAEQLQQWRDDAWGSGVHSQATVPEGFGEDDVLVADPPVVEALFPDQYGLNDSWGYLRLTIGRPKTYFNVPYVRRGMSAISKNSCSLSA